MKVYFDTEFIEDGKTIELLSIALVREDWGTYYAEPEETDRNSASEWVKDNVIPYLHGPVKPKSVIAREIVDFVGPDPEFWAYYADYDWVALCQIYGCMTDLPSGWPMFCMDVQQDRVIRGVIDLPKQDTEEHNALNDAVWTMKAHKFILESC